MLGKNLSRSPQRDCSDCFNSLLPPPRSIPPCCLQGRGSACFSKNAQSSSDAFQGLNPELERDQGWAQEQILNVSPLSESPQSSAPSAALQLPRSSHTQWVLGCPAQPQPTAPSPHLPRANSVPAYFYRSLTHIPDLVHPAELKAALCKKPAPLEEKPFYKVLKHSLSIPHPTAPPCVPTAP